MDNLRKALLNGGFSPDDIDFPASASDARIFNLRVPVIPRVVVTPRTVQLVSTAVRVADEFDLKV
jgi:FAD/FMN-containing dehydrogenase